MGDECSGEQQGVAGNRLIVFFCGTATTEIYTLSLHDALPISVRPEKSFTIACSISCSVAGSSRDDATEQLIRSEEHTSELQSHSDLVCRLLLEKKKDITQYQM